MLRPYQIQAIDQVRNCYKSGVKRVLLQLATGAGKTRTFSYIAKAAAEKGSRVLVTVHGVKLVEQASARLDREGVPHGVIQGTNTKNPDEHVLVTSIDTLFARKIAPKSDLIIVDEAHQSRGKKFDWFLEQYPNAYILAVSATPHLKDGLRHIADEIIYPISIKELTEQNYLVPLRYFAPTEPDLSRIKIKRGDYDEKQLGDAMAKPAIKADIVKTWKALGENRPTIMFCVNIKHSLAMIEEFREAGIACEHVDAKTPTPSRNAAIARLISGETKIISNVGILGTGVDIPELSCIISARPTRSYNLWIQQCLDDETEVLTNRGFKKRNEIISDDLVAAFDMSNESLKMVKITNKIERLVDESEFMVEYNSPHLSLRVTNGHDMIYRAGRNHRSGKWAKIKSGDLLKRKSEFSIPTAAVEHVPGIGLTKDELIFIGIWCADGTVDKKSGQLSISQSIHQPWIDEFREIFKNCGFKWRESIVKGKSNFKESSKRIRFTFRRGRESTKGIWGRPGKRCPYGISRLDKFLNKELSDELIAMNRTELSHFLYGLNLGDGTKSVGKGTWIRRSYTISCGRKVFADRLQSICVRRGYQCNVSKHHNKKWKNPIYYVHIKDSTQRYIGGQCYNDRPKLIKTSPIKNEIVWCVENELGTIVIRRKGKIAILGNCGRGTRPAPGKSDCLVFDHASNTHEHGFIENERRASLDPETKQEKKKRDDDAKQIRLFTCKKCFAVYPVAVVCPACGERVERKQLLAYQRAKELAEVKKSPEWLPYFEGLLEAAKKRGYKKGYVYHIMKQKYGEAVANQAWNKIRPLKKWAQRASTKSSSVKSLHATERHPTFGFGKTTPAK